MDHIVHENVIYISVISTTVNYNKVLWVMKHSITTSSLLPQIKLYRICRLTVTKSKIMKFLLMLTQSLPLYFERTKELSLRLPSSHNSVQDQAYFVVSTYS